VTYCNIPNNILTAIYQGLRLTFAKLQISGFVAETAHADGAVQRRRSVLKLWGGKCEAKLKDRMAETGVSFLKRDSHCGDDDMECQCGCYGRDSRCEFGEG